MKIIKYKVVTNRLPAQLSNQVNSALANGWQLWGGIKTVVVGAPGDEELVYVQAVVLKQSKEDITNG